MIDKVTSAESIAASALLLSSSAMIERLLGSLPDDTLKAVAGSIASGAIPLLEISYPGDALPVIALSLRMPGGESQLLVRVQIAVEAAHVNAREAGLAQANCRVH